MDFGHARLRFVISRLRNTHNLTYYTRSDKPAEKEEGADAAADDS